MEDIEEIQYVTENEHLTFDVIAWNEKNINDILTFDVRNLPEGATFTQSPNDPNTYIFSWTPGPGTARSYPYRVTFIATSSDGYDDEDEDVSIYVQELDKTTILNTILSATRKIASVVPGNEVGQYPQSDIDAFQTAIDTAQGVADDPNATNAEVSQAVTDLKAAEAIFDAARITSIDKSALTAAITAANTKVTTASPGTGIGQYPQASIDAFRSAIDTARRVADDPNATNAEVSQAVTDLKAAEDTFDASRQMPPASVTNLRETATGTNWVHWEWTNPTDADFSHVMVYIDGVFVTTTPNNYYNATGFLEGTVHAIGIQTVDTAGNINPATMTDQATTRTIDRTPPASVTNLRETATGTNWIHWEWTNPNDADFGHVRIYIDGAFVTTTPSNSYNATGLSNGAEHTIAIETVDTSGNINTAQVSDTATTLKLPVISNVAGRNIRATSITLEWDASEDTATVQISVNGILLDTVTGPTYVHNGLNESTTYNYTLVPFNQNGLKGEAISISLATSSSSSGGGSSGGSSSKKSSSSSSSGGGGGAGSVEDFANVALKDVATRYLRMNANATYEFTREGNPIQSISFYSLKNSGEITSTIEVLNNRSKLVSMNPEGLLYKYVNIWVGKAGFATPANIEDAQVRFIVSNSWMEEMAISADDISLQRYNGSAWEILPTTLEGNNTGYSIFKAQTPGFSPFAITAGKKFAASIDGTGENSTIEDIALENTKTEKSRIWTYIMAFLLVGILVVGYEYMKRYKS
ncbi:PGF-pre-PGF domain-containing protein [Methanomethylovorans sp.]|uniref:PGF-pre-PGF domain-containing protein n=2 Tax=Methanomethylovorans sp. TaxID=2758717 RepID=UPI00345EF390